MAQSTSRRGLITAIAIVTSFCSFGYQQLLALTLADATGDFVLSQALTLALFVGGMGLGSALSERGRAEWLNLLRVEWLLALLGALCVNAVNLAEMALRFFGVLQMGWLHLVTAPLAVVIGILNGVELPYLVRLRGEAPKSGILAANYFGAFAAAVIVPVLLLPALDVGGSARVLSVANFVAASGILPLVGWGRVTHLWLGLGLLALMHYQGAFGRLHLQWVYFSPRYTTMASLFGDWSWWREVGEVLRLRSSYQWIDIVPPEFTERIQGRQDFQLYLDRRIQLSSGSHQRYHESMVKGGIHLLRRAPERVLVLGGGDGILVKELLQASAARIDLVELDPRMIELARHQRELSELNGHALDNPRVSVYVGDAFRFVRESSNHFDLVLIDLPFPVSFELSLLFTKEFYALVGHRLSETGILVLDFPQPSPGLNHVSDLVETLAAAGFARPFGFGQEDFFVAAARDNRTLHFEYAELIPQVADQTLFNLVQRTLQGGGRVNSVFKPVRFVHGEPGGPPETLRDPRFLDRFYRAWREIVGLGANDMPLILQTYWRESMSEARDFMAFGLPRFQFGLEWTVGRAMPIYQWIEEEDPGRLRSEWSRAYCLEDSSPWYGVRWAGDKSWVEFIHSASGIRRVRRYEGGRFIGERDFFPGTTFEGPLAPLPNHARAAHIQLRIQRRFLSYPRTWAPDHFYFP